MDAVKIQQQQSDRAREAEIQALKAPLRDAQRCVDARYCSRLARISNLIILVETAVIFAICIIIYRHLPSFTVLY